MKNKVLLSVALVGATALLASCAPEVSQEVALERLNALKQPDVVEKNVANITGFTMNGFMNAEVTGGEEKESFSSSEKIMVDLVNKGIRNVSYEDGKLDSDKIVIFNEGNLYTIDNVAKTYFKIVTPIEEVDVKFNQEFIETVENGLDSLVSYLEGVIAINEEDAKEDAKEEAGNPLLNIDLTKFNIKYMSNGEGNLEVSYSSAYKGEINSNDSFIKANGKTSFTASVDKYLPRAMKFSTSHAATSNVLGEKVSLTSSINGGLQCKYSATVKMPSLNGFNEVEGNIFQ